MKRAIIAFCLAASTLHAQSHPSRYLYVWAGTAKDSTHPGVNMITVIDANPSSKTYGAIINAVTVDTAGLMPHHTELVLPAKSPYFANDFLGDKSYLIDFSDPAHPKSLGKIDAIPNTHRVHSYARLPNGHVLATYQFGNGKEAGDPGGLAEFDAHGHLLRTGSSIDSMFPDARIRTYALTVLPKVNRVVTTSNPMDDEVTANVVQVWRLSDLKLLRTIAVPGSATDKTGAYPFELKALADGSVFMNTYRCGFFHITNVATNPKIAHVMSLKNPPDNGCGVPLLAGKFWIMPIPYGHRVATFDISDPMHPKEVASFPTDPKFNPHWISADPFSDRVVIVDQGDGTPTVYIAHLDRRTGTLKWDEKFRDPGSDKPGVTYNRMSWPNGVRDMAMPHGALFVH